MSQQTKAFFRTNGKKLQAGSFSILLAFMFLLGLLQMFSWPLAVAQAQSGHPLKKTETPLELKQKGYGLHLPSLLQVVFGFQDMEIVWDYFSISDDYNNFSKVSAMTADEAGHVWLGGYVTASPEHGTVHRLDPDGTWRPMFATTNATPVMDLAVDNDGYLWVAAGLEGAYKGEATATSPVTWQHYPIGDNDIRTVAVEGEHIWFGTGEDGAYRFTPESSTWLTYTASTHDLCSNTVHKIAVAGNGDIWFGTDENGLCKLDTGDQWTSYLTGTQVSDIAFDGEGNVWVAAPVAGVISISPQGISTTHSLVEIVQPSTIIVDSTGRKWIGSYGDGVAILSADNGDVQYHDTTYIDSLADNQVLDIVEAANGDIWVGHEATYPDYFVTSRGVTHISGVTLMVDSPVPVGVAATLTATVEYGSGVTYTWGFGDGSPVAMGAIVTHTYQAAGNYPVVVTASNSLGAVTATTTIQVGEPISGLLAVSSSPSELNDVTVFTATVTAGDPVSYTWDFGDGSPVANGSQASHVYSDIGSYTAVVTAANFFNVVTTTTPVTITDVPIAGLAAANDGPATVGSAVTFSATITAGTNVAYTWAFGDGETGGGAEIAHVFTEPGMYTAVVTASNSVNVVSATTLVTITDVPIAGLAASNDSPTIINNPTTFVASIVAGTNVSYTWDFGDGAAEEGIQASHTYAAGGFYTAVVTASNSANWLTATTVVEILAHPDLNLVKTGLALVPIGSPLVYEISVANQGVEPASHVVVTDTLPVGIQFISQNSPYAYAYDPQAHTVVWTIPLLPEESTETFLLQTQVMTDVFVGAQLVNTVSSTLDEEDVYLQNNQATFTTTVIAPPAGADLTLIKTGSAQVIAGTAMAYEITAVNLGDLPASGVVITDHLPGGMTFISSSHPAYNTTYDADAHTVAWRIGTLAAGASYHISMQVQVPISATIGAMTNSVIVAANNDVNTSNNGAAFQTEVAAAAPQLTIAPATNGTANGAAYLSVQQGYTATRVITVTNTGTDVLLGGIAVMADPALAAINYPWLTVDPLVMTDDLAPGTAVTLTITAVMTPGMLTGNYYDIIGFDAPHDTRVSAQPFYLRVYAHPPLYSFSAPVTNTLHEAVPGAQVVLTKQSASVWVVDGISRPNTYFAQTGVTGMEGTTAFSAVEEGVYTFTVSAAGHRSEAGVVTIPQDLENGQLLLPPLLALPGLVFEPAQNVNLSVTSDEFAYYTYRIRNEGPAAAENFAVITSANLPWVSSGLPAGITRLAKGEAMSVTLFLDTPPVTTDEAHDAVITVTADYVEPARLQAHINVLVAATGDLEMTVTDLTGLPVAAAHVWVTNQQGRLVHGPSGAETVYDTRSGTTDAYGQLLISELPPATYDYYVQADGYYYETGTTQVQTGAGQNQAPVQMTPNPFTYNWTVVETTITDTYAVTVAITYEADVLEPLLYVNDAVFCPGDNVNYIVANVGPVTMTNIVLDPAHGGVTWGPVDPVTIGTLAPGEAFTGTFSTSGTRDTSSKFGHFNVTANYETEAGSFPYTTSSWTDKHCPVQGGGEGGWSWEWHGNHVTGRHTGSRTTLPGQQPPPAVGDHEVARLILSGDVTLERQAFNARLELNSLISDTLQDVTINMEARAENGLAVVNGFAVTPTLPTHLGDLNGDGALAGEWLIVPGDLGITDTAGAVYNLRAQIVYTLTGQVYTVTTIPQLITVYPQPYVQLMYSHTQPDDEGDFYVEISARNDGYGLARHLKLDLSEVTTLGDLDGNGRSLIFELEEAILNGQAQPLEYIFDFGDMEPGEEAIGRWRIGVYASDGMPLTNQIVTGFDVACKHEPYRGLELSALINCGDNNQSYLTDDCPFCGMGDGNSQVGGPINTANGNYTYRQSTPRLNTAASPLQFTWTYNSLNTGISPEFPVLSSALGLGWTHNYQMALDLSQIEGTNPAVVVRAPHGTPIYFYVARDGFTPAPGAHATMTVTEVMTGHHIYTVTTGSQATFVFSDTGRLLSQIDARGNVLSFTYDDVGLRRVEEPISGQYLAFDYDENGRLATVTDPISRTTRFGYDEVGYLDAVTDTRGFVWQYDYAQLSSGMYLLSQITDPDGRIVEHTGFDEFGRAITQTFRGQDLTIAYFDDGRRLITYGMGANTQTDIHVYNAQDLLVAAADNNRQLETYVLDRYQNRVYEEDRNGNPTWYDKTPFGYTTAITDALGFATNLEYDARNNWTRREDGRGEVTLYDYDEHSNLITETNHLGDTVTYTYNNWGQMTSVTDENDVTTRYGFDPSGQLTVITNSLGLTTTYEYDAIGRLITSTDIMGRVTVNVYDAGDNLVQVTANVLPGYPQNYLEMYNVVTQYGYDGVGHQVAITDTLGRVNLTLYNEFGQVVTQVVNYDGVTPQNLLCTDFSSPDPEYNICSLTEYDELGRTVATTDSLGRINRTFYNDPSTGSGQGLGRVVGTINNWSGSITDIASLPTCLALPQNRDYDICTLYGHDAVGNSTVMTDTVGRVTRTFYDSLNRIDGMIMNWDGQTTLAECQALPAERDNNVCMRFGYDEVGNTIIVTDTLGQMTRTFYDELGRTWATVANWNPATLTTPVQCVSAPDNDSEENICSLTEYDAVGNPTVTTNALGQQNLTVYDDANRPFIQVANWDGITAIADSNDCHFPPLQPDSNLCMVTLYDKHNRPYATIDPLGGETQIGYDEVGRVVTTTRMLDGVPVQTVIDYDAAGRRASQTDANGHTTTFIYDSLNRPLVTVSPGGVAITQTYDALGRVLSTTNNLGQVTHLVYDDLDRLVSTQDAEENVTAFEYDVLGNQVAITDANDIRTSYLYDGLQRLVQVTENDTGGSPTDDSNLVTRYTYDVLGNQVSIVNARNLTSTHITYDGLYRPIATTDALGHETRVQYNALGARMVITDANGEVTRYQYDALNRPITITYEADGQTVSYEYNTLGSRLAMHDGLGTTRYQYDDLYRLTVVTDTLDAAVGYAYDRMGNRTGITYPDGKVVTYTYDLDNRLDTVTDWNGRLTDYEYDGLGRLITTTLPNGVHAVNRYDDANHLLSLTYTAADDSLLAEYLYEVDGVGNRQVVTETLLSPGISETLQLYQEVNGLLVLEAENGTMTIGNTHNWISQTVQSGYAGDAYLRALPDVGQRYETNELANSPRQSFSMAITNPADYTVWVRGMAPDAAGDSVYIGINGNFNDNAALTGFTNQWSWSRQTMSDTQASLPLTNSGVYTLDLAMREDGLRIDRLLLVTDTNYIPSGTGPDESQIQIITDTVPAELTSHTILYTYDGVYRLTDAAYTGDITATYQYSYDSVGNMTAYTETLNTQTTRVTRYFDDANRLQDSFDYDAGTTSYLYDNNGNLTLIIPPNGGSWLHYGYDQRNLMISHTLSVSGTNPQLQAEFAYDGAGSRVQQVDYTGASPVTTTYVNDIVGLTQVLVADDGTEQVYNLFGLDLIGQDEGTNTRYLG